MTGHVTITLSNTLAELARVQEAATRLVTEQHIDPQAAYAVELAVEELVSNVIRHGFDDHRKHRIGLTIDVTPETVDLTIEDDGRPFDPNTKPLLEAPTCLDDAPTGGMGLTLVKQMAGPIQYSRHGDHNRVIVRIPRHAT